jgi:hypothetical protein
MTWTPLALQQKRGAPVIFSVTELGDSLQRCESSWIWGSLNGFALERPQPSTALALGSLVHYTMADWGALYAAHRQQNVQWGEFPGLNLIIGAPKPDPIAIFNRHFKQFEATTRARYAVWRGAEMDDSEWQVYEDEVGELGEAMIGNYQQYYGTPYPEDCTLLRPELTLVVPLPKIQPRQRQFYLEGTMDLLLLDSDGYLFPWDHKTYNDHPNEYELKTNDQFMSYCWMADQEFPDYIVGGFMYNGWWKRKEITSRMRRKDGTSRDTSDLFHQDYLLYSDEQIQNQGQLMAFRAVKAWNLLQRRVRFGPAAIDKSRWYPTCPGCSFNDICKNLNDGDFGDWDDDAEEEALGEYVRRIKTPAWRVPLTELAVAA